MSMEDTYVTTLKAKLYEWNAQIDKVKAGVESSRVFRGFIKNSLFGGRFTLFFRLGTVPVQGEG